MTIKLITGEEMNELIRSVDLPGSCGRYMPYGCFLCREPTGEWTAADNSDGHCWVETFDNLDVALAWLNDPEMSVEEAMALDGGVA